MELQYRGTGRVYFKEKENKCDLYYNEKEGGILLKIIVQNEGKLGGYFEIPLEMPFLCGQLENGFKFTLLHLVRTGMNDLLSYGRTEYTFSVEYLLCGIGGEKLQDQTFHTVDFFLSNILEWGGQTVYEIGKRYELVHKDGKVRKMIFSCPDYDINYSVVGSMLPVCELDLLRDHIELEQHGIISVEFKGERKFDNFIEVFSKLKRLIEIAVLDRVNIERIVAYSSSIQFSVGDITVEQSIEVIGKTIKKEAEDGLNSQRWKWFDLSELISNHAIEHYFSKYEKLAPIIELFLEPLYIEMGSNTHIFLNIIQALETYHSRFVTNDIKEFTARVEQLSKKLANNCEEVKKFLIANSSRFITLESRLADLLLADGNRYIFDTGKFQWTDFPSVLAHSRHYYIHYDEGIKEEFRVLSEEELQIYNRTLLKMLEYYLLLELGFSNSTELQKKLYSRWGNVSRELEIYEISKKHSSETKDNASIMRGD